MEIRQAVLAEIEPLRQLGISTYRHYFGALWQSPAELEAFLESDFSLEILTAGFSDPQQQWWVACEEGRLLGFAKVHDQQLMPESEQRGAMLCKLYLQPGAKSRGLGSLLFNHVEQQVKNRQQNLLWLTVLQSNTAAIAFYQRQGMVIHSESAYVTQTQTTPLWTMKKELG